MGVTIIWAVGQICTKLKKISCMTPMVVVVVVFLAVSSCSMIES